MKRIIDGVTYNTDTSAQIGRWNQKADNYNPTTKEVILYKTRGGAFFLHEHEEWSFQDDETGEWVTKHNDSFQPLTRQKAHDWMMEGDTEVLSDEFELPPEATAKEEPEGTIYVRVPQSFKVQVDAAAKQADLSTNAWAMRCMESCLAAAKQ